MIGSTLTADVLVHDGRGKGGRVILRAEADPPEAIIVPARDPAPLCPKCAGVEFAKHKHRRISVGALSPGDRFLTMIQGLPGRVLGRGRIDISDTGMVPFKLPPTRKYPLGRWVNEERRARAEFVPVVIVEIKGKRREVSPNMVVEVF